jgi:DNA-directed RNA polymerase subunit L
MENILEAGLEAVKSVIPDPVQSVISMVGGALSKKGKKAEKGEKGEKGTSSSSSSDDDDAEKDKDKDKDKPASDKKQKPRKERQKKQKPQAESSSNAETDIVAIAQSKSKHASVATAAAAEAASNKLSAQINAHKLPVISNIHVSGKDELQFTLENADVSIANGLRRILLSEIPCIVFRTEVVSDTTENTVFHVNTTRHHNEILKQRLRCVPICIPSKNKVTDFDYKAYRCEVQKKNTSDVTTYVTTEDFKVIEKVTGKEDKTLTKQMFVPDPLSGHYIEFARLLPRVVDYTDGEELHFSAEFQISTAEQDSAYNVCSTCTYACTPDKKKQDEAWEAIKETEKEKDDSDEKNWRLSSAQRIVKPNSFDFTIETVSAGVYTNGELVRKACDCMKIKCEKFIESMLDDTASNVVEAKYNVTMPLAYNIVLKREGYTLGKALEHLIYSKHYYGDRTLTFCAFKKTHPHDVDSFIQVALQDDTENNVAHVSAVAVSAAKDVISMFEHIKKQFISQP